jgi:hypothetical protein
MANTIILKKSSVAAKVPLATDLAVGELAVNLVDQKLYSKKSDGTVILVGSGLGGAGDVVGAASSTDNAFVRFDGTNGKIIQNSGATLDDTGNATFNNVYHTAQIANRAVYMDANKMVASSATTATELGYLSGVTSAIQTQLNSKQASLGYTPVNKAGDTSVGTMSFSTDAPIVMTGTSYKYVLQSESSHVAFYKKAGTYHYYFRKSNTGYLGGGGEADLMYIRDDGWVNALTGFTAPNSNFTNLTTGGTHYHNGNPYQFAIDATGGAVTIGNGGFYDISNFSGFLVLNSHVSGSCDIYLCGGGVVSRVGATSSAWLSVAFNSGINGYTLQNLSGGTISFGFVIFRTRPGA